ncbi:helix-turn-helix transcriptional regulator [Nonomuraea sp. MCN248]|uniref:Helix-turn-helix transcriptional regulator n=1 Tax=Nonomuraea corallina TaxID=2989783 RepID=A0ABT4S9B5_9ACTN|nr:helix-turn-helix transcriptional regulator [Nonomuraea corallina]MDA0633521.1 helix-turn-helix transcriptional regulator [Nonomuraea corallina]
MNDRKPTPVPRLMMAAELRRLRDRAGMTGDDVKERLGWSTAKLSKIENARIGISPTDAEALLDLYDPGLSPDHRRRLLALTAHDRPRGWWRAYAGSSPQEGFAAFLDIEAVARAACLWEADVVPGLLQTEAYARELIQNWQLIDTALTPEQIEYRIAIRMKRQQLLEAPSPLHLHIVLDESVLMRHFGSPAIMRAQLRKLLEILDMPNVHMQLSLLGRPRQIAESSFTLLMLSEPGDDAGQRLVWMDMGRDGVLYLDQAATHQYGLIFNQLARQSIDDIALIRDTIVSHLPP